MNKIQSVFSVENQAYSVEGYGQPATTAIRDTFPNKRIIFVGFMIDGRFVKFDPSSI